MSARDNDAGESAQTENADNAHSTNMPGRQDAKGHSLWHKRVVYHEIWENRLAWSINAITFFCPTRPLLRAEDFPGQQEQRNMYGL